jgi:hypothetical protein
MTHSDIQDRFSPVIPLDFEVTVFTSEDFEPDALYL